MGAWEADGLNYPHSSVDDLVADVESMYDGDWEAAYTFLSEKHAELENNLAEHSSDSFASLRYALDNGPKDNILTAAGVANIGFLADEVVGHVGGDAYSGSTFYQDAVITLTDSAISTGDGVAVVGLAATPVLVYAGIKGAVERVETYASYKPVEQVEMYRSAKEQIKSEKIDAAED